MKSVEHVQIETLVHVSGPYEAGLHPKYRSMGGTWCPGCRSWHFDPRHETDLRTLNRHWLGDDGMKVEQVHLRIVLRAGSTIASLSNELLIGPLTIARLHGQRRRSVRAHDRALVESGLLTKRVLPTGAIEIRYAAPSDAPGVVLWGPLGIGRANDVYSQLASGQFDAITEVKIVQVDSSSAVR